jgi:GGDEF domain-containing protein
MQSGVPRRRPARPVPEAPIEALAARAEELAKAWLVAVIECEPLSSAPGILAGEWASDGPRTCAAVVRALGSDEELGRIRTGVGRFGRSRDLDPLRAVVWSALRSAWPEGAPDQIWDLGERLAVVIEALRHPVQEGPQQGSWPRPLEEAVARVREDGASLSLLLAELADADRVLAVEPAEECAAVLARFRAAVHRSARAAGEVVDDGEARVWVIAPGAGTEEAGALASGIAAGVRNAPHWRGAPLTATLGVAVLGQDGEDAKGLIDAAEEAMFSAAAGGIEIARGDPGGGSPASR